MKVISSSRKITLLIALIPCLTGVWIARAQTSNDVSPNSPADSSASPANSSALPVSSNTLPDAPQPSTAQVPTYGYVVTDAYTRPSEGTKLRNYAFDAFGPYPVVIAAATAGIHQISNAPPEWGQDLQGYSYRLASDFGISLVSTTSRYVLAEAIGEDTLYYRCDCKGVFPRLGHAMVSTFTGRYGADGHRRFSVPAVVAPYAGNLTAFYGWYPARFGAQDAFRAGSYSLLIYMGGNVALEFFYGGPHSLLSRMHLQSAHVAPDSRTRD